MIVKLVSVQLALNKIGMIFVRRLAAFPYPPWVILTTSLSKLNELNFYLILAQIRSQLVSFILTQQVINL